MRYLYGRKVKYVRMSRQVFVALVIVVVIGGLAGAYYYVIGSYTPTQNPTEEPSSEAPVSGAEETGITELEAARQIQSFIDSRRTEGGFYKYSYNCEKNLETDCGLDLIYETTNSWTAYSNLAMYRATGEKTYLEGAKRDADRVIEWCSDSANNKMCSWILVQIYELYEETVDKRYSDFLLSQGETLLNLDNVDDPEIDSQRNSTMMLGIEARELALIYKINGDERYVDEAKVRIERAYGGFTPDNYIMYQFNGNSFKYNSCWPELANIALYEATKDTSYLEQSKDLLDTFDPAINVVYMNFLTNLEPCIELYQRVYDVTGEKKYMEGAGKMLDYMLKERWDSPENMLVSGSGTVLSDSYSKVDTLTDVAYMVVLLARQEVST